MTDPALTSATELLAVAEALDGALVDLQRCVVTDGVKVTTDLDALRQVVAQARARLLAKPKIESVPKSP